MQFSVLFVVICYNFKFLFLFFFELICFLIDFFLAFLNTKFDISTRKPRHYANGLFGLSLIDFFNLRGIIKPLNWVYIDADKSVLIAEPTTEVILAAKLKTILGGAKTAVYFGIVGGSHLASVAVPALGGFLDIRLIFDENFIAVFYDSALNSTWSAFQENTLYELDSYFKAVINNLDQTPGDKVPLRKWQQFAPDRFDALDDADVIRRRDLAREG